LTGSSGWTAWPSGTGRNGEYAIWLLVAHTVLTIWGYAVADHTAVVHETGTVLLSYPDVLTATFALGLLIMVGIVSARAARRRLRFETWYFIHLYTYLAIALSFAHQLATGNDFITHPLNRFLWVSLYLLCLGLLVAYRAVIPVRNALRHRLRVASVVEEAPGVVSIYVTGRHLEELRAEAGQFFLWRFLTPKGWWQAHPFSLSAAGRRVTDVQAPQLPYDRPRSASISQYVAPVLRSEALAAQSAQIDTVPGATYTSDAYAQSLQAALAQAGM